MAGLIIRVFSYVALGAVLGFVFKRRGEKTIGRLIWLALNVFIPIFILVSLWSIRAPFRPAAAVFGTALAVLGAGFALAWAWARARRKDFRDEALPIVIMNSAYLALPVCSYLGGSEAFEYALIYNAAATIVGFTFGIMAISRGNAVSDMFELPVIYCIAAGILLNLVSVPVPAAVLKANSILSMIVLPCMLMLVGYKLSEIKLHSVLPAVGGVALRMGGGLIVALACVKLLGLAGAAALVCLLSSSMPAAVNTYIMAEYYKLDVDFAAATVVIGTILSLFTIPAVWYLSK